MGLQYIYTGCSLNLEKHAEDLMAAAGKYHLDQLKGSCEDILISKLDIKNCIQILLLGEIHQGSRLKSTAVEFFTKNMRKFESLEGSTNSCDGSYGVPFEKKNLV